jgi:hypothetical protein
MYWWGVAIFVLGVVILFGVLFSRVIEWAALDDLFVRFAYFGLACVAAGGYMMGKGRKNDKNKIDD